MVEIGVMPILWHIMKIYSAHGLNDFVICCGYKGHIIKDWFAGFRHMNADITFDFRDGSTEIHDHGSEPWRVTLVDTGAATMTGGRIKRAFKYVGNEPFCLTYGDGVSDVDITASIEFHRSHKRLVTMTAVQPEGRFGVFSLASDHHIVERFLEKPNDDRTWINGGFFVVDTAAIDYINGDETVWEVDPLQRLALDGQLMAYQHEGFWAPMDTLRDKNVLEGMWNRNEAPWKCWSR
jgi:glucose-1-phosphate cytidylyltransferase